VDSSGCCVFFSQSQLHHLAALPFSISKSRANENRTDIPQVWPNRYFTVFILAVRKFEILVLLQSLVKSLLN
jgi:hypothetical protein